VVVDGERWPLRGTVLYGRLRFSPDGRHVAYVESAEPRAYRGPWRVVVDGKPGRAYDTVSELGFTAAGEVHYGALKSFEEAVVVVGDRESPIYDRIEPAPLYEPLGGHWSDPAPVISADGKHSAYGAMRNGKGWVVLDGQKGPTFLEVGEPVFSPDGRSVAYLARVRKDEWAVVRNGRPGPPLPKARGKPASSPDGTRLAYAACPHLRKGRRGAVAVVDGTVSRLHDMVSAPSFSADSRHVVYIVRDGEREWVVVDGRDGPQYDEVYHGRQNCVARLTFHSDGSVDYLARRGDTVYRVRQFPPGPGA
jgi:hypothetical protein